MTNGIRLVSLGKHQTSLYSDGKVNHSSITGGLATLAIVAGIIAYSIITLVGIKNMDHVNISSKGIQLKA